MEGWMEGGSIQLVTLNDLTFQSNRLLWLSKAIRSCWTERRSAVRAHLNNLFMGA